MSDEQDDTVHVYIPEIVLEAAAREERDRRRLLCRILGIREKPPAIPDDVVEAALRPAPREEGIN